MRAPEAELFKDKIEISLDGKQVFYLFFGGAVIACLVFVMGVLVGRRVEARAHVDQAAIDASSLDPLAALDRLGPGHKGSELTFADTLTGRASDRTATGSVEVGKKPSGAIAEPELRQAAEKAAADKAAADRAATDKAATDKAAADKAAADKAAADKAAAVRAADKAAADKAAADKAAAKKAEADKAATKKAEAESPGVAKFTLQLSSFQVESDAQAFAAKLRGQGYSPSVVHAMVPDKGEWYRVRIGGYTTYDDAVAAKAEFERAEQIIAYVTRIK